MRKLSEGKRRSGKQGKGAGAWLLEGLEDRRLMSVGVTGVGARFETSLGRIELALTPGITPLTVANFLSYVNNPKKGHNYNNTVIHRSAALDGSNSPPDIIQGGGFSAIAKYPHIATTAPVNNEFQAGITTNVRGTIAMAKTADPNSATSEWFFNVHDNSQTLDNPANSGGFTTFGTVIGGGMNTVDAIAALPVRDATPVNGAFSTLPVMATGRALSPVVVSSVKQTKLQHITIGDGTAKVIWTDERGGQGTITLSSGTADLMFAGLSVTATSSGDTITVRGKAVDLEAINTSGTDSNSTLSISVRGNTARIGDIRSGTLAAIKAANVDLAGDITASGSVNRIDLRNTDRSSITVGSGTGTLTVNIQEARDLNVSSGIAIASLAPKKWVEDGAATTGVSGAGIQKLTINGNFSGNINSSGDVNKIQISGAIGILKNPLWNISGNVGTLQAGSINGLSTNITGIVSTVKTQRLSKVSMGAAGFEKIQVQTVTDSALGAGSRGIGTMQVSKAVTNTLIRSAANLDTLTAGSMSGSAVFVGYASVPASTNLPTDASGFTNQDAVLGKLRVAQGFNTFVSTNIVAPVIQSADLGTVVRANHGQVYGVAVHRRIGFLTAQIGHSPTQTLTMTNVKNALDVDQWFAPKGKQQIAPGDFRVLFV